MRRLLMLAMVAMAMAAVGRADAAVIGFEGAIGLIGPTVEDGFRYDALSGGIFRDDTAGVGNPIPDAEGAISAGGGVLRVVRADVVGGLFNFSASDIAQEFYGNARAIEFQGFRLGVLQATDVFNTSSTHALFTTVASANLTGVAIDELRITLDAAASNFASENVDNLVVNAVPEPTAIVSLVVGIGVLALRRRQTA